MTDDEQLVENLRGYAVIHAEGAHPCAQMPDLATKAADTIERLYAGLGQVRVLQACIKDLEAAHAILRRMAIVERRRLYVLDQDPFVAELNVNEIERALNGQEPHWLAHMEARMPRMSDIAEAQYAPERVQ